MEKKSQFMRWFCFSRFLEGLSDEQLEEIALVNTRARFPQWPGARSANGSSLLQPLILVMPPTHFEYLFNKFDHHSCEEPNTKPHLV